MAELKALRDEQGRFISGNCANPGGRPKALHHITELAKQYTEESIDVLAKIMQDEKAPANFRIQAACALLDRAWGKPKVEVESKSVQATVQDWLRTLGDRMPVHSLKTELEDVL